MKKFFSLSSNQIVLLLTLVFILVLGVIYFFVAVPNNERTLERQRFIGLQSLERTIRAKVYNSVATLNNLIIAQDNSSDTSSLNAFIKNSRDPFTLHPVEEHAGPSSTIKQVIHRTRADSVFSDSLSLIDLDATQTKLVISLIKQENDVSRIYSKPTVHYHKATMDYNIRRFMAPLLPVGKFDHYIIFYGRRIIYETFPSGVTDNFIDSIKAVKNAFASNQVKDVQLGGIRYKLFAQQFYLTAASDSLMTIAGLLDSKDFQLEKNQLDPGIVVFMLILAIGVILALPWLKLFQMGSKERLTASDGVFTFIVAMLLMSMLFLVFLKYIPNKTTGHRYADVVKMNLVNDVKSRLLKGIKGAYDLSVKIKSVADSSKGLRKRPYKLSNEIKPMTVDSNMLLRGKLDSLIYKLPDTSIINVTRIYAMANSNGKFVFSSSLFSPKKSDPPPTDNSNYKRDYYKSIHAKKYYYLDNDTNRTYYLDQIVSWTTGQFTSVLSRLDTLNGAEYVTSVGFNFKCFQFPVITPGFINCIIDKNSKVLYHSDTRKNLNEQLFDELSDSTSLQSAMSAHDSTYFETRYGGKNYRAYAEPIAQLPYYIVVFENASFSNLHNLNSFSFAIGMLFSFFVLLGVILLVVFFVSIKSQVYNKTYFDISWLGPIENFHAEYVICSIGNLIIIATSIAFIIFLDYSFLGRFFVLLVSSVTAFLFQIYLSRIKYSGSNDTKASQLKKGAIVSFIVVIVGINAVAFAFKPSIFLYLISFEITLAAFLYLLSFSSQRNKNNKIFTTWGKWNFTTSFTLMLFTRLIITSGVPAAVFYIAGFNYETSLLSRYRQTQFMDDYLTNQRLHTKVAKYNTFRDTIWTNEYYFENSKSAKAKQKLDTNQLKPIEPSLSVFEDLTTNSADSVIGLNRFNHDPNSGLWKFYVGPNAEEYTRFKYTKNDLTLGTVNLKYSLRDNRPFIWVILAGALLVFWLSLRHLIKKLFALDLPSPGAWGKLGKSLITDNSLNDRIFIVRSPGSDIVDKLLNLIRDDKIKTKNGKKIVNNPHHPELNNFIILDAMQIPNENNEASISDWRKLKEDLTGSKYSLIILHHFEYDIKNPVRNQLKLDLIEELRINSTSKIMIVSAEHPVKFLDSINLLEKSVGATNEADKKPAPHYLEKWKALLGGFTIVIEKLHRNLRLENNLKHSFEKEFHHLNSAEIEELHKAAVSLKIETAAFCFYTSLWQHLTNEEKFLLYDIAEDGLVNSYDDYNLTLLINKGLILKKANVLMLFNNSFRIFILSTIGSTEAMRIREEMEDSGNWGKLKGPLLIFIAAVLIFLFASQQEAYATITKYLTAITVGVPALLKVLSLFNQDNKKVG